MSNANDAILRYVAEDTANTTPEDSADWKEVRYTSESLTASPEYTTSEEVRSDRMVADNPVVSASTSGDISIELSPQSFDDFIEAAVMGTWGMSDGVLETGKTARSFSIEKEFSDISKFINFTGMRVDSMSLDMSYGSIITGSFSFVGAGASTPAASAVGTGTSAAVGTTETYVSSADVGSIEIDGSSADVCISSLSITVENAHRDITCIGSLYPSNQREGTSNITGSLTMYLSAESFELYKKSLESERISIGYTVTDGTNSYNFLIPNSTLQIDAPQSGGLDSDVEITADFVGIYDSAEDTNLRITRTPA